MSIVTAVDVALNIDPKTYTFRCVKGCNGKFVKELTVDLKTEWASYWTEDHRVCPPPLPPTLFATIKRYISLPLTLVGYIITGLFTTIFKIFSWFRMAVTTFIASCRYKRSAPVVTRAQFYNWLKRNGFTSDEMKQVKEATKDVKMYAIAHKLTDVRAVEGFLKLQSIEKQKLVIVVLQQSTQAIDTKHQKQFEKLRNLYTGALFSWGAQDAYRLGDVIAKNGRMCGRGEGTRKKADWEQRVASKVNLRVNAVLRCINTIASEGRYSKDDAKMTDLVRTVNRTDSPVDWNEFVAQNRNHENRLLAEIHTAATYVKQYTTHAIVTESYSKRVARICWAWTLLLTMVAIKLAKVVLRFEIDEIGDVIDLIVGAITDLAESPSDLLDILESGPPTGSGVPGTNENDMTGTVINTLNDKFGSDARLDNKEAQLKASMKVEKVVELDQEQNPAVAQEAN
ncbi:hypothetical protein PHYPSEUDO_004457 [Phytophthora pseudosyringae]|uniref:Uncharacterized protein n=1 Tax=Phytophthora pseudosyringae TaxID=221518 RepID=A0A8T1WMK0_9STRA|nr:hypothetical protein PHYPSEUDO_004457 [Phytophthora pseudosyringae]